MINYGKLCSARYAIYYECNMSALRQPKCVLLVSKAQLPWNIAAESPRVTWQKFISSSCNKLHGGLQEALLHTVT